MNDLGCAPAYSMYFNSTANYSLELQKVIKDWERAKIIKLYNK